jgi:hypothetical protein
VSTLKTLEMLQRRHNGETARGPYTEEQLQKLAVLVQHQAVLARALQVSEQEKRANVVKALLPAIERMVFTGPQAIGTAVGGAARQGAIATLAKPLSYLRNLLATPVIGSNPSRALMPTPGRGFRKAVDLAFAAPGKAPSKTVGEATARAAEGTVQGMVENPGATLTGGFMVHQGLGEMDRLRRAGVEAGRVTTKPNPFGRTS